MDTRKSMELTKDFLWSDERIESMLEVTEATIQAPSPGHVVFAVMMIVRDEYESEFAALRAQVQELEESAQMWEELAELRWREMQRYEAELAAATPSAEMREKIRDLCQSSINISEGEYSYFGPHDLEWEILAWLDGLPAASRQEDSAPD